MRQITINVLKFSELDTKQKSKVLDKMRDINVDHEWYEYTYQEYTEKLEAMGFRDIKIEFSGFWSQGDGACFTAKHDDGDIYKINNRYSHSNTVTSDNKELLEKARQVMTELYRDLQKEYEYLTSDDAIVETIESNDYEFRQDDLKLA